jgi:DNA invertase Pin-like site-specific DNA recombinase
MSDNGMSASLLKPLRAALYARVSSQQQADANTIASQVAALRARIRSDGLTLDEELCFLDEGYSCSTLFRPALERLRDQAAAGIFDRLYVHSPDRLARAYPYQFLLVEELQRHGIEIVFLNRDIGKSPEDNLLLQMQGMMAEYERAKILERSRRGKRHAAQAGAVNVLGQAPFGYRYISKYEGNGQARYEIDEAQAEVVRRGVSAATATVHPQPPRQGLLGSLDGLGHPQQPGLPGRSPVRQDAGRAAATPTACAARPTLATPGWALDLRYAFVRTRGDCRARDRGRGPVCRRRGAIGGESSAPAPGPTGSPVPAARIAGL